jgi:pyruvate/2-oxoglutarate dehydrogenase complex dihydrolipoamide dehydrogenase (E3) component
VPWCTYTDPEVAHVGLQPDEARGRGEEVATMTLQLGDVDRAILDGEEEGVLKVHYRKGGDRVLGATLVARHAGEMISELVLAITTKQGLGALSKTIHPYPTQAEIFRKAGDRFNRQRLTPRMKKVFEKFLQWRR